jgi:hypothetical protein
MMPPPMPQSGSRVIARALRTVRPRSCCPVLVLALVAGCGGGEVRTPAAPTPVTTPTPSPAPASVTLTGTLTDTITGASIGTFSETVPRLPATLTLSALGHVARTTRVSAQGQVVDLIPESGFDLEFYRQFARDSLDGAPQPLRTLSGDPSFFMEIEGDHGFAAPIGVQMEAVARRIVPDLPGGRLHVLRWETGPTPRAPANGWIVIERTDQNSNLCGQALLGATAGHIWLDSNRACNMSATFAHEIGHALGFSHVTRPGSMMLPEQPNSNLNDAPTELERRHGAIAYKRARGNQDVDVDP